MPIWEIENGKAKRKNKLRSGSRLGKLGRSVLRPYTETITASGGGYD
jgi:hypothetical protein